MTDEHTEEEVTEESNVETNEETDQVIEQTAEVVDDSEVADDSELVAEDITDTEEQVPDVEVELDESEIEADELTDEDTELDEDSELVESPELDEEALAADSEQDDDSLVLVALEESISYKAQIEAAIFASPKALKVSDLSEIIGFEEDQSTAEIEQALEELVEEYTIRAGGFRLEYVKRQGYQFRTVQAAAPLMDKIFSHRPRPLSKAALETLAIIAYRQPVTRADIEFIRGVDAGSIVKNLLDREMISCVGRKEVAGRPMIFGTTNEFLRVFGVSSIKDLPPLSAFQPSQEVVQNALSMMDDESAAGVDIEKLIGDGAENPEVSAGILAGATAEDSDELAVDELAQVELDFSHTEGEGTLEVDADLDTAQESEFIEESEIARGLETAETESLQAADEQNELGQPKDGTDEQGQSEGGVSSVEGGVIVESFESDEDLIETSEQPGQELPASLEDLESDEVISSVESSESIVLEGASVADFEGFEDLDLSSLEESDREIVGASSNEEQDADEHPKDQDLGRNDETAEVDCATGTSIPEGSGEMDLSGSDLD